MLFAVRPIEMRPSGSSCFRAATIALSWRGRYAGVQEQHVRQLPALGVKHSGFRSFVVVGADVRSTVKSAERAEIQLSVRSTIMAAGDGPGPTLIRVPTG